MMIKEKYIDPFTDFGFKWIFGTEENKLTYIYLEMPKFKKSQKELSTHLDYWLYTLNNMNNLTKVPELFKEDELINQAFDVAEFLALDDDSQFSYQHDLKTRLDYKNVMDYAKETAREEGLEEGKHNKALEIAKNLKVSGIKIETIATITGLSLEVINEA